MAFLPPHDQHSEAFLSAVKPSFHVLRVARFGCSWILSQKRKGTRAGSLGRSRHQRLVAQVGWETPRGRDALMASMLEALA